MSAISSESELNLHETRLSVEISLHWSKQTQASRSTNFHFDSIRTDLRPRAPSSMVCVVSTIMKALPSGVTACN